MTERFTPLYEWLSSFPEISQNEALVISRVKMWGQQGCFESYTRIAKFLKLDRSTVIRIVKQCVDKEYLLMEKKGKAKRFLWFNHDRFTPELMKGGGSLPPVEAQGSGTTPPVVVAPRHPTIYSQDRKKQISIQREFLADSMTTQPDISKTTELAQRRELIRAQAVQLIKEEANAKG